MINVPCAIDPAIVRQMLLGQFPQWGTLPLAPVPSAGTDNMLFRLGDDKVLRLPRHASAAAQLDKEVRCLPVVSPRLPMATPLPLGVGRPTLGHFHCWAVCKWVPGVDATREGFADQAAAAKALAGFLSALQAIDTTDAPRPGAHNFFRGEPLIRRDEQTRAAIDRLGQCAEIDPRLATAVWDHCMTEAASAALGAVWIHGDLHPGNVLVNEGKLVGVIDFGGLAAGDAACDLMAAWTLFTESGRHALRQQLDPDHATWLRARGWALSFGVVALDCYRHINAVLAATARRTIEQVLMDAHRDGFAA